MTRNNATTKRVIAGVTTIGLGAGADSYVHIYGLARDWHQNIASAALAPLTADGLVFASSAVMFAATREKKPIPFRARFWFWVGTIFTVAGNAASGWSHGPGTAILNVVPVIAYIGCMESLTWMLQHLGAEPKKARVASAFASAQPVTDTSEAPEADTPEDELQVHRQRRTGTRQARREAKLAELLERAEAHWPEARIGKIPVIREIEETLSTGQPYAQAVQRHFKALQPG